MAKPRPTERLMTNQTTRKVTGMRERKTCESGRIGPMKYGLPAILADRNANRAAAPIMPEIAPEAPTTGVASYGCTAKCNRTAATAVTTHSARKRRSEEHTSELQSREKLVCRHPLEKKN